MATKKAWTKPWMKFAAPEWRSDPKIRLLGYAERGLCIDIMAVMHSCQPYGHLLVDGKQPSIDELAALLRGSVAETRTLLRRILKRGALSMTDDGTIYSPSMVTFAEKEETDRKNGALGGNPNLKAVNQGVNPTVKARGEERGEPESIVEEGSSLGAARSSASDDDETKNIHELVPSRADARPSRQPSQPTMLLPISGVPAAAADAAMKKLKRDRWLSTLGEYIRDVEPNELPRFWPAAMKPAGEARAYLNAIDQRMQASFWWSNRKRRVAG
jgi:hypothetical protein